MSADFHTVTLRRHTNGWVAHFNPPGPFGPELPTGFTARAAPLDVLAEIVRLNPDYVVLLGEDHVQATH